MKSSQVMLGAGKRVVSCMVCKVNWFFGSTIYLWIFTNTLSHFEVLTHKHLLTPSDGTPRSCGDCHEPQTQGSWAATASFEASLKGCWEPGLGPFSWCLVLTKISSNVFQYFPNINWYFFCFYLFMNLLDFWRLTQTLLLQDAFSWPHQWKITI
jgi:hypothetical protein